MLLKKYKNLIIVTALLFLGLGLFWVQSRTARSAKEEIWGMADAKEIGVNSKMSGRILELCVDEGDEVKQGQLLARVDRDYVDTQKQQYKAGLEAQISQLTQASLTSRSDRAALQAALTSAEARLKSARADYNLAVKDAERYEALYNESAVSRQTYEVYYNKSVSAEAALQVAEAGLNSAQAALVKNDINTELEVMRARQIEEARGKLANVEVSEAETEIRAPFDGIITKKYIEQGSMVGTSAPLFSLQDQTDNWVNFKIKETEVHKYQVGQTLKLVGRNEDVVLEGRVAVISKKPDYATIKATSERGEKDIIAFNLKVQTNDSRIWPGMRFRLVE